MSHICQALVFRCIDFRLRPGERSDLLAGVGYPGDSYDLVSLAGSAKDILSDQPGEVAMIKKQISISLRLHQIKEVIILLHDNCGAYAIADAEAERQKQVADLAKIKEIINQEFPSLGVKSFIIQGTATGNLSLVPIS
ncbi:MAG: hypothetical protein A3A24_01870 [Candidatus Buchananbacteria bacterium RIFCSPLOWO2_01_FULL_46_12]|uniref:Carbonic anhydrase n=2 Tax=Candidatus Buchananiibacteriota TaxID=1817903 RepID=A0A1G1YQF7_9BACT|nr:MAG: hypothetical protein A2744_00470 [Candidatus Buchananbacteria bacterium RIFCSPHIGHO2_01_FULL_44_11]OGY53667.1 MAG: hypothetical protein A3A24_01870 [Candidatus Buchananbacteria bacterium RIFCSPLOWO2_01_FULL_46_12]